MTMSVCHQGGEPGTIKSGVINEGLVCDDALHQIHNRVRLKVKDGNVVHIILKVEVSRLVLGGKIHKCKVWSGRTWSLKARNSLSAHLPDFIKAVFCLFIKDEAKL